MILINLLLIEIYTNDDKIKHYLDIIIYIYIYKVIVNFLKIYMSEYPVQIKYI